VGSGRYGKLTGGRLARSMHDERSAARRKIIDKTVRAAPASQGRCLDEARLH
jgi:hypothetical protein